MEDRYRFVYTTLWKNKHYMKPMEFSSRNAFRNWDDLQILIKQQSRDINMSHRNGISKEEMNALLEQWIELVMSLVNLFGTDKLTADIRSAVHEAEEMLGRQISDFGVDNGYFHEDHPERLQGLNLILNWRGL